MNEKCKQEGDKTAPFLTPEQILNTSS